MWPDVVPHVEPSALAAMIDPARTALVVIDVQNDFAAPDGAMGRLGLDLSCIEKTIDRIEMLIAKARSAGAAVAFARVMTSEATDSGALRRLNARKGRPPNAIAVCRADQPGSAYYRIAPRPGELEIAKRQFNTFHDTDFDAELRARGVDTLIFVGFTTDCCVDATARDAFHRGYDVFVVSDATDAYGADLHWSALRVLQKNVGLVTDTAAVLYAWGAS